LSPRGADADAEAVALTAAPADQGVTDADFDVKAWRGEGRALHRAGLRRIVVRELPQSEATGDTTGDTMVVRAVIDPPSRADRSALQRLNDHGVRGLRFRLDAACDPYTILSWAERIVALDWHVEVELPDVADTPTLTDAEWVLLQVPVPTCFSGLAGFVAARESESGLLLEFVEMGRFWLKLSGTEIATAKPPTRDALRRLVNAAMTVRQDRLVWGSGPSLPSEDSQKHIETAIATLRRFLPDAASSNRVLWSNPAALYRF
jgi:predicted TIM-barrel fold metal-dependent hydrolase